MGHGRFSGEPETIWLTEAGTPRSTHEAHSRVRLYDPDGQKWTAPGGSVVDGASIPRALWTIVGSAYTGDYRRASVLFGSRRHTRLRSAGSGGGRGRRRARGRGASAAAAPPGRWLQRPVRWWPCTPAGWRGSSWPRRVPAACPEPSDERCFDRAASRCFRLDVGTCCAESAYLAGVEECSGRDTWCAFWGRYTDQPNGDVHGRRCGLQPAELPCVEPQATLCPARQTLRAFARISRMSVSSPRRSNSS
jgi:Protein of unknown function (DUF1353)